MNKCLIHCMCLVVCGSFLCLVLCWRVSVFGVYNAWRGLGTCSNLFWCWYIILALCRVYLMVSFL